VAGGPSEPDERGRPPAPRGGAGPDARADGDTPVSDDPMVERPGTRDPAPTAPAAAPGGGRTRALRLELTDPARTAAAEDRPELWGDARPDDVPPDAEYLRNRPPHHG
jgi:hypothetical protein